MRQGIYKRQYDRLQELIEEKGYHFINDELDITSDLMEEQMEVAVDRATEQQIVQFMKRHPSAEEDFIDEIEFYEFIMTEFAKHKAQWREEIKVYFKFNN
jgi:hypothetical protein